MLPQHHAPLTQWHLNPSRMWHELRLVCEDALGRGDPDVAQRIFEYASWCLHSSAPQLRRAVEFAFYQHVPVVGALRDAGAAYLTPTDRELLADVFTWQLAEDVAPDDHAKV